LTREDASLLVKLIALQEDESFPAVALGWDGPDYAGGELRGLYLALSKQFPTAISPFQIHGGLNSAVFDDFQISRDLRGFLACSTSIRDLSLFFEADEFMNPDGPRLNAGGRVFFDPISLGIEFRDLGATRNGVPSSRMLRISYTGLF
jgi:hypothetical protein